MASLETISPVVGRPPESVQPGGGWCMRLALAWGRLRRAYLRWCWPDYVRRMTQRRQGNCPDCPHDIIDGRDLKYTRNVCGFWFLTEDDPFQRRARWGLARYGLAEVVIFSLLFLILGGSTAFLACLVHGLFWVPFAALFLVWLEILYFFRDPERTIPTDPDALISPADGTITHIEEVEESVAQGEQGKKSAAQNTGRFLRISIFLSIFNVHVNRIPRTGRIVQVRYFPGAFLDARNPDSAVRNEQLWIDLEESSGRHVRVKQISGAIARRIVCWLKAGDQVKAGERLGMIKLGSRTDILLAKEQVKEICVKIGDKVKGGATILARLI